MIDQAGSRPSRENPQDAIRLLEQELADTNREVMALTLELDKRVEDLRAAEQRYRSLAESAPDVILRFELQPQRVCTYVNPRITTLTGYAPAEFYADAELCFQIVHPDERAVLDATFRGDSPDIGMATLRWVHKNGTVSWIEQRHGLVRDPHGRPAAIECIARDITERKQLEAQLQQAQKMEAIGRLAGGVAHDFNNLLTVIMGYSAQALETLVAGDPLHDEILEIQHASERAASLTRQLLTFSRRQVLTPRVLNLNTIVADMDRMLRRLLGEDVEVATALDPGLDSIRADPGQMEQVLLNLAVNSRDAMPGGGKLLLETANIELDEAYAHLHFAVAPGAYVMLAVSDTGCGMDPETQAHIFEPFFTTKAPGEGTGLGLSTVFGIVQQSGGNIGVYSEPGKGTTFKIYFPSVAVRAERVEARPGAGPAAGSETVLVVEDEDAVRKLIRSVLTRAGYIVLEASDGAEALELCRNYAGSIQLVISDLVMPQMSGSDLAGQLAAQRPDIRLLLMSGYTAASVVKQRALDPQTSFLQKPFTPAGLAEKVRETLDRGAR